MSPLTEPTRIVLAKGQPVPNDPYLYTNTVLLLHGDGTNGSTTILDSSKVVGSPKTVTAVGNAQISTAQSKFGGASIAFDGSGDYLSATANSAFAFGTGDFTLEGWFYFNNGAENASRIMYANYASFVSGNTPLFFGKHGTSGGKVTVYLYLAAGSVATFNEPTLPPSNQWLHYALVKAGNSFTIYRDGIATATATYAAQSITSTQCNVGGSAENASFSHNGYIDDFRITKGIARYTSNFPSPTAPFPDF